MLTVESAGGALGAFITGLDITGPLPDKDIAALKHALAEYQVIFFRDQNISHLNHRALGQSFGPLLRHPSYPTVDGHPEIMILDNDRENPSKIDDWHVDMSFTATPPLGSILVGRVVPRTGGDTMFASLGAAYDDLSESMKKTLGGLTATHSLAYGFRQSLAEPGGRERLQHAIDQNPDVVHPMLRTHPVSGRKIIFYSPTFTRMINELSAKDSEDMLSWLNHHVTQEKYIYRFKWRENSIAFWDNRSVIHKPVNDYWPARRRVERVTIKDSTAFS
jgi:taurine dioxygenase